MKFEDTIIPQATLNNVKTYASISNKGTLTLCDPITQLCRRIEAFFENDPDITCRYIVNNHKSLGPKIDPDTGEQMTKLITVDGEQIEALLEEDHYCEMRVFCSDYEKAQCLANVIRHRHVVNETYIGSDDRTHLRYHYLIVHVCTLNAIDPDGQEGGSNPWIIDDNTDQGVKEIFGLEPIDWSDPEGSGCNDRLSPLDTSSEDIPKGVPDEYEQLQWEDPSKCAWKWKWLKNALKNNKNIININYEFFDGTNTWRFIECGYRPIVFFEDNLASITGSNSILPADLLPLVFSVFGAFQIGTYARKK